MKPTSTCIDSARVRLKEKLKEKREIRNKGATYGVTDVREYERINFDEKIFDYRKQEEHGHKKTIKP